MTDQIKIKAQQARELLGSSSFRDVIKAVRERQTEVFLNTHSGEAGLREEAHTIIRAIDAIENELTSIISAEKVFDRKMKTKKTGV